jgi:hypothetical protein
VGSGGGSGVLVGGSGVLVGSSVSGGGGGSVGSCGVGTGVSVGGTGVSVGGFGVRVGTGVSVGTTGVSFACSDSASAGGLGVAVALGVSVGRGVIVGVADGGSGVKVGVSVTVAISVGHELGNSGNSSVDCGVGTATGSEIERFGLTLLAQPGWSSTVVWSDVSSTNPLQTATRVVPSASTETSNAVPRTCVTALGVLTWKRADRLRSGRTSLCVRPRC